MPHSSRYLVLAVLTLPVVGAAQGSFVAPSEPDVRPFAFAQSQSGDVQPPGAQIRAEDYREFSKRAVLPLEAAMGFSSRQSQALFSAQLSPQATVVLHRLRVGGTLGAAYTNNRWVAYAGPKAALRLHDFKIKVGSLPDGIGIANLHAFAEHLWAGDRVRLLGGGITLELLQSASLTLKVHRDYGHRSTWGQVGIAYNLLRPNYRRDEE